MTDIQIRISKETRMIDVSRSFIGNDAENLQGNFVFSFKDEFVNGVARLEYAIKGKKYFAMLQKEEDKYFIPILSVMTKEGQIPMQIVITESEKEDGIPIFKSNMFYVYCNKSINAEIEQPDEYPQWIEIANAKLMEFEEAIERIETLKDYNILNNKPMINGVELLGNLSLEELGIQSKGNFIEDEDYTHTDNNFTNAEKDKLAGLENYDDTMIQQELTSVGEIVDAHDKDISNIANDIDIINENIQEQDENINHLADTKADKSEIPDVSGKQDKLIAGANVTIKDNVISALADVDIHVEDGKLVIG